MISIVSIILFTISIKCHGQWILKWHDEFDGNELDNSKWLVTAGQDTLEGICIKSTR